MTAEQRDELWQLYLGFALVACKGAEHDASDEVVAKRASRLATAAVAEVVRCTPQDGGGE